MRRLKYGYKTQYSIEIIDHIKANKSLEEFAEKVCCTLDSIYLWFERYPEFYEAYKIAMRRRTLH